MCDPMKRPKKQTPKRRSRGRAQQGRKRPAAKEIPIDELEAIVERSKTAALSAEEYEKLRVGASHETVMANITAFLELREKLGSSTPEVQVSAVETERTRPFLEEFIRFWRPRVERVRIFVEHSRNGEFGSIDLPPLPSPGRRLPCRKVMRDTVVYWDGRIALCNHDWLRREPIGSLDGATLSEIWQGERYRRIRDMHTSGEVSDSSCRQCDHWMMYYLPEELLGRVYAKEETTR